MKIYQLIRRDGAKTEIVLEYESDSLSKARNYFRDNVEGSHNLGISIKDFSPDPTGYYDKDSRTSPDGKLFAEKKYANWNNVNYTP